MSIDDIKSALRAAADELSALDADITALEAAEERDDEAIAAKRAEFDAVPARIEALEADLVKAQTRADAIAKAEAVRAAYPAAEVPSTSHVQDFHVNTRTHSDDLYRTSNVNEYDPYKRAEEFRGRALEAIEKNRLFREDAHRESATAIIESLGRSTDGVRSRLAEQIVATSGPEYVSAFAKFSVGMTDDWTSEERAAMRAADEILAAGDFRRPAGTEVGTERALTVSNVTGKLVPAQLDTSVILTNSGALNPFREISRVVPVTTNVWTGINTAGVTAEWTGTEGTQVADATPTFSNPAVTAYMWDAFVPMSFQSYEDWYSQQGELETMFVDAQFRLEEAAFATGSGTSRPTGIVTCLTDKSNYTQGTNSAFTSADLFGTREALAPRWLARASWVMNMKYEDRIRQFGTNLGSLYTVDLPTGSPVALGSTRLFGAPIYRSTTMDGALNTSTNYAIVYGDFSQYLIADRIGRTLEFIPNLFSAGNGRPTGQRGWLIHGRVGGSVVGDVGAFVLSVNPHS